MKVKGLFVVYAVTLGILMSSVFPGSSLADPEAQTAPAGLSRENAYRENNIGVALLEQFKYKEGVEAFRNALKIDSKLSLAHINLSIALYNLPDLPGAERQARTALTFAPNAPQPYYILGLIAKTTKPEEAVTAFQQVLKIDANDVGANINLGQIYAQQRKFPEAIQAFRVAIAVEPYNGSALYGLGQALLRTNQRDEGLAVTQRFKELRERGSATGIGNNYLEQGRYAEAVASTGAEVELVDRTTPPVTFADATNSTLPESPAIANNSTLSPVTSTIFGRQLKSGELSERTRREIAAALGGAATLFDFDGDGDLDLFWVSQTRQLLYANSGGKFVNVTNQSGALNAEVSGTPTGAVSGDFDNDGKPDLFVIRDRSLSLYHNDGGGKFSDVTAAAAIPAFPYLPSSVAFVDLDHDGDLDVVITGLADLLKPLKASGPLSFPDDFAGAPNLLLRNDGNGKFTDSTATAKLNEIGHAVAVVPTDFNNRRDMDLLVVNYGSAPRLFSNQRDGTFRNVSRDVGLETIGSWTCAAAGDVNKDGFTDFFFGKVEGPGLFALSQGNEKFKTVAAPAGTEGVRAAQILDYDNDGLLDCVMLTSQGVRVWRNIGTGWVDTTDRAVAGDLAGPPGLAGRPFVAGDIDNEGDTDIIVGSSSGSLRLGRNDGGNLNHSLHVNLTGKVSNRSGIGAKIEARAGSLVQKLETSSASPAIAPADVAFGLGKRLTADAVRVLWPAGIVQAETEIAKPANATGSTKALSFVTLPVTELDRKPSSCPYLYTWNGEQFEFITDFMGGGEMGYLEEPGRHNKPDPDEYVRIRGDQLKERNGRYELRVTNELEEALFADRFQLLVVDHPREVEVYPNEGMTAPPRPFKLYATRGAHPPLSAVDDHGNDVLSRVSAMDRQYPDDFRRDRIRGYADEHTLTMQLAEPGSNWPRMVLLLTGWTDYAWSSDNVAAAQSGKTMSLPLLQVKDAKGEWRTVIEDIGIPVGRPQTVTVDLTGKFLSASREVRIVTNMRILWDQILVDTSNGKSPLRMARLDPASATLRWRGFSREGSTDGREPFGYDYREVSFTSPWKVMPGSYTREGDVRALLVKSDDMFVISRPGDEIGLSFDARQLPTLAVGWTRTFLLYSDGYSKEMDINSASPDQVLPLPFHGMTRYPYPETEHYPMTAARRAYMDKYNTRVVKAQTSSIDTVLTSRTNIRPRVAAQSAPLPNE
jgi:tetratricopeptide (TPR) repeat protein